MAVTAEEIRAPILATFPDGEIEVIDLAGDGEHYELRVKSAQFNGMSKLAQHKLVYEALGDMVGGKLHALALKTSPK
jgi:stress-induced morphogen